MRKGKIFLGILVCFCSTLFGQSKIKKYIQDKTVPIRSIQIADTNYSDLENIGKAIGESRIVMLGEQDHGDAPTFLAKARLVKYLHEKMGFNVLVFESDFYGLTAAYDEALNDHIILDSVIEGNLFPMWTMCQQFSDLKNYVLQCQRNGSLIHLAGIDQQFHGQYSIRHFPQRLDSFLVASGIPVTNTAEYKSLVPYFYTITHYSGRQQTYPNIQEINNLIKLTDTILAQLNSCPNIDSFWLMAVKTFQSACKHQLLRGSRAYASTFIERDKQMADNLAWLSTVKYPNEKLIVWAANGHISRNSLNDIEPSGMRHISLGYYFTQRPEFANNTYVLGFTSYEGNAGRTTTSETYTLPPADPKSVASWMKEKGYDFSFIDFKKFRMANPKFNNRFLMSGDSHFPQKNSWTNAFDGIFFVKTMYACGKIE